MKNKQLEKLKITWDEVESDLSLLQRKLEPSLPLIKNIYGIPRGGLILAILLSHRLNLPIIIDHEKISRNTLVIDDICDIGNTIGVLKKIIDKKKPCVFATLWYHNESKIIPDYFVKPLADTFIQFPWETARSSRVDKTLQKSIKK